MTLLRHAALALGLAAATAGCAGTSRQMIGQARPAVAPESVRIYHARPPGAVDIAHLDARSALGFGTAGQRDAVITRLRREAAALGGNGVLLLGGGRERAPVGLGVGVGSYGRHGGASVGGGIPTTQEHASGIALFVPDPDALPPAQ